MVNKVVTGAQYNSNKNPRARIELGAPDIRIYFF